MANTDTEPKWYILHTYSGYESMVKDSLARLVENNNLGDSIFDVKIPTEQTIEEKANGKRKVVERKLLPCYVFIKMIYSNQLWYLVTNTLSSAIRFPSTTVRWRALSETSAS